jgi:hypothetical protein
MMPRFSASTWGRYCSFAISLSDGATPSPSGMCLKDRGENTDAVPCPDGIQQKSRAAIFPRPGEFEPPESHDGGSARVSHRVAV